MKRARVKLLHQSQKCQQVINWVRGMAWGELLWYWLPLLFYVMAIFFLSSLSAPQQELVVILNAVNTFIPSEGDIFPMINDKIYHIIEYALLAVLTYRAFRFSMKEKSEMFLSILSVVLVVGFGCTDEIHQWFTPLRYTDGWDLLADAFGGIIGVSFWQGALSIQMIRILEERIPLKLQVALGDHVLRI